MSRRALGRWLLVWMVIGALVACNAPVGDRGAGVELEPSATSIAPTATADPVSATGIPTITAVPTEVSKTESSADPPSEGLTAESLAELTSRQVSLPFTYVAIGDTQDKNPKDTSASEIFAMLIRQINELQPDFVIHLGDVSDRGTAFELNRFESLIAELDAPIVTVAGNHDTKSHRELFSSRYVSTNSSTGFMDYSFDYGGVRFVVVDNSEYYLSSEQLEWLDVQLQTDGCKIVSMHCPPDYGRWKDSGGMYSPEGFMKLMKSHEVDLVYCGHFHLHSLMQVAGTRYVISGCGGGTLSSRDMGVKQHGFDLVTVGVEGIETEFVPLTVRMK